MQISIVRFSFHAFSISLMENELELINKIAVAIKTGRYPDPELRDLGLVDSRGNPIYPHIAWALYILFYASRLRSSP
ncbi:MAG: hypothetical protein ABWU84_12255 [Pyrobaculum sp.]|uniref:hypothetical protein n=1 Tax=Pyrobaculum sp. TaxID=2004705 RepID=UPI003EECB4F9